MGGRSRSASLALAVATGVLGASSFAYAESTAPLYEGFDLNRLYPSPAGDHFDFVPEPVIQQENSCAVSSTCGAFAIRSVYAVNPLRIKSSQQDADDLTSTMWRTTVSGGWSPHAYWQLSLDVPVNVHQTDFLRLPGRFGPPASASRVGRRPDVGDPGDVRLGVRFVPKWFGDVRAGAQAFWFAPTGDRESLMGDSTGTRADGLIMVELEGSWLIATGYAGYGFRPELRVGNGSIRSGAKAGAAASLELCPVRPTVELRFEEVRFSDHPVAADLASGVRLDLHRNAWTSLRAIVGLSSAPGVPVAGGEVGLTIIPWIE